MVAEDHVGVVRKKGYRSELLCPRRDHPLINFVLGCHPCASLARRSSAGVPACSTYDRNLLFGYALKLNNTLHCGLSVGVILKPL